jgi:hypothetical protein
VEALAQHGSDMQVILRLGRDLQKALKGWHQAQLDGNCGDIRKFAEQVVELSAKLSEPAAEAAKSWDFDSKEYLSSSAWLEELVAATSKDASGIRAFPVANELVCSPVVVRADPSRQALKIGKKSWKKMKPDLVIAELKKISSSSSGQNSQILLDSLCAATEYLNPDKKAGNIYAKLRDIYELYCLVPGYKKDNPELSFAQALYALHRSEVQVSRSGRKYEFGFPEGQPKSRDLFTVIAADGRTISYYMINFK